MIKMFCSKKNNTIKLLVWYVITSFGHKKDSPRKFIERVNNVIIKNRNAVVLVTKLIIKSAV